jgi:ethanolamine utilization protein EutN
MRLAMVVGTIVSTMKNESLHGRKLLLLKHLNSEGFVCGPAFVATDAVGAGTGETVFYVRSKEAAFPFFPRETPTDATVVGIVDRTYHSSDNQ